MFWAEVAQNRTFWLSYPVLVSLSAVLQIGALFEELQVAFRGRETSPTAVELSLMLLELVKPLMGIIITQLAVDGCTSFSLPFSLPLQLLIPLLPSLAATLAQFVLFTNVVSFMFVSP